MFSNGLSSDLFDSITDIYRDIEKASKSHYARKVDDLKNPTMAILKAWLDQQPEIHIAIIYGSFATGKSHAKSDLDIAIAEHAVLSVDRKLELLNQLSKMTGREVDFVDLQRANGTHLNEILTKGLFLKKTDPHLLARILIRMWSNHEDFEKNRKVILTARRKRAFDG